MQPLQTRLSELVDVTYSASAAATVIPPRIVTLKRCILNGTC